MTTRRQFLGATAFAAAAAPTIDALAQAVTANSQFNQSGLVGKLEGPSLATTVPGSFKEAPQQIGRAHV